MEVVGKPKPKKPSIQHPKLSMNERARQAAASDSETARRISIGFLNWAHAIDHYVMLIYPTAVIGLPSFTAAVTLN